MSLPVPTPLTSAVQDVVGHLRAARFVPTVRAADADSADSAARDLLAAGVTTFEFTATTPAGRRWSPGGPPTTPRR
ncbi:hypothetical protein [Streptomyces olivaceus]|uniref:hypothetical protein n=1 Tax=Streptomyces olivaceus TaxID=47716 RepID=UPI00188514D8|nr:hypothetical protein [Streptomyces olivaceus]